MSDEMPNVDPWLTEEPYEVEMVPADDPRLACGKCGTAFDPATWPDCPECEYAEQTATREEP